MAQQPPRKEANQVCNTLRLAPPDLCACSHSREQCGYTLVQSAKCLTGVATGGGWDAQDVDRENEQRLEGLSGEQRTWEASEGGDGSKGAAEALKFSPFPETLRLKLGAQVVCLWNLSDTLVNGSRGVVVGYQEVRGLPVAPALNPGRLTPSCRTSRSRRLCFGLSKRKVCQSLQGGQQPAGHNPSVVARLCGGGVAFVLEVLGLATAGLPPSRPFLLLVLVLVLVLVLLLLLRLSSTQRNLAGSR
jgi:hypothetical protein